MKKILMVGAEVMPFAATGGLGDVLGSLPAALAARGDLDVRVMMPLYGQIPAEYRKKMKTEAVFSVRLAWREQYCGVLSLRRGKVTYYFIDNEYYFKRGRLYGEYDDGERFAFFSMAALSALPQIGFFPDILHAHDHQAGLVPVYLNLFFRGQPGYEEIRTVFTIHNIEYQGQYDFSILGDVFALPASAHDLMDLNGALNLMKGAVMTADAVTTVSPRYAEEICTPAFGHGMDSVLRLCRGKLTGILNGIDYVYYNPGQDPDLFARYNWRTPERKEENKRALRAELSLPDGSDIPMLSVISRLVAAKGMDLFFEAAGRMLADGRTQLVVLGTGERRYEDFFKGLEARYPGQVRALIRYDRKLAKRIYAASDIFLMPSAIEACGLSQMIASRYGAIPVVHETGGLFDSIKGYWEENGEMHGNGFTFANYSAAELAERTGAAAALWRDRTRRRAFVTRVMRTDFSFDRSAGEYMSVYEKLKGKL